MSDDLPESPGLALNNDTLLPPPKPTAPHVTGKTADPKPERKRPRNHVGQREGAQLVKLSLADRAKALATRKKRRYKVILMMEEDTFERLVSLAETGNWKIAPLAERLMREGMGIYMRMPRPKTPLEDDEVNLGTVIGQVPALEHAEFGQAYRAMTEGTDDTEAQKALLKSLGVPTT